jgi:hypothetical protein
MGPPALGERCFGINREKGMLRHPERFEAEALHLAGKRPRPRRRLVKEKENSDFHGITSMKRGICAPP